jgi:predicted short-subunit dehydrogenase-like oxidoreductase (DUF2520 family)
MFRNVRVVGRGRLGSAVSARLHEQGNLAGTADADLVVLCVPDAAIASVAQTIAPGPWIAHMSGATSLTSLAPHVKRFSVHPLQTFCVGGSPEQFDGAWGAVTGDSEEARQLATWLARRLGLRPFDLADDCRPLYHAGASIASNFLVTLHRAAAKAIEASGVPAAALLPLMQRTMDNNFELTGPIARGDWTTVEAHLAALRERLPDVEPLYRALAEATRP